MGDIEVVQAEIARLLALEEKATPGPWFAIEHKHGGLGPNHNQERIYRVEMAGDGRCRDGSPWRNGLKRWSSRVIFAFVDWCDWTDHPHNRDWVMESRNSAPALLRLLAEVFADKPDADSNGYLTFIIHKDDLAAAVAAIKERV